MKIEESVTRLEVIDQYKRRLVLHNLKDVRLSYQDDGRTLKIFIKDPLAKELEL